MGICEAKNPITKAASPQPDSSIKTEAMMKSSPMISLEPIKSICKIIFDHPQKDLSSGFLIKLFKDEKPFYCLMTNEHSVDKEMIKRREIINVCYDN